MNILDENPCKKNRELRNCLLNLAELHYSFGLIGVSEYEERCDIAFWLADDEGVVLDPRAESFAEPENIDEHYSIEEKSVEKSQSEEQDGLLHFTLLGTWIFTKADPDYYPSVPHGHYRNQNKKWPKLNPYTGRVFDGQHQEDTKKRLTRNQMRSIWNCESFKSFCREMIVWYRETFPKYRFPVCDPLVLPRWR